MEMELSFEYISSMIQLVSFSYILYSIYHPLLFIAIVYANIGIIITMILGHPLIQYNVHQLKYNANLRYIFVRYREYIEAISLYRQSYYNNHNTKNNNHHNIEQHYILQQLYHVVYNQYHMNQLSRSLDLFTYLFNLTRIIVPVVVVVRWI